MNFKQIIIGGLTIAAAAGFAPLASAFEVGVSNMDVHNSTTFRGNTHSRTYTTGQSHERYSTHSTAHKIRIDGDFDGHFSGGPSGGDGDVHANDFSVSVVNTASNGYGFNNQQFRSTSTTNGALTQRSVENGHRTSTFTNF